MYLDNTICRAIAGYTQQMLTPVMLIVGEGAHPDKARLIDFLQEIASTSEQIVFDELMADDQLAPTSFTLSTSAKDTGIVFTGVMGGQLFSALILAILQAGGYAIKLDNQALSALGAIDKPVQLQTLVELNCVRCAHLVQALNALTLSCPMLSHEIIDVGRYPNDRQKSDNIPLPQVWQNGVRLSLDEQNANAIVQTLLASLA